MSKLYVDKSVEIESSPARVWEVLTSPSLTQDWASEFSAGGPQLHIESDWAPGSPVFWKDKKGRVVMHGLVTAVEPYSLLRYTVLDVEASRNPPDPQDGITCKLTERAGKTVLWVSQGDFSVMPEGAKYRDLTEDIWERALARIRRLSEGRAAGAHRDK